MNRIQVNSEHYDFLKYVDLRRWNSFFYQLKTIYELKPNSVLEIGPGKNILANFLKNEFSYVSLDIDKNLKPDVVGSTDFIPFGANTFDVVLCFQVLEHLPYEKFLPVVENLLTISRKNVIISLPFANHPFSFDLFVPFLHRVNFNFLIPRFYKRHKFDGQHYWEVGTRGYSKSKIAQELSSAAKLEKMFIPFENTNHIFFVLGKKN